jgi:hypothetical protein
MGTTTRVTAGRPVPKAKSTSPPKIQTPPGTVHNSGMGFCGGPAINMFIYGPSGVGKTSFAGHFPKTGFFYDPQELGVLELLRFKRIPKPVEIQCVSKYDKLLDLCDTIANGDMGIQTAVFDSSTGFEKLCFHYHCETQFGGDWTKEGFYAFQTGPKNAAKTDWPLLMDGFNRIQEAGINVLFIGHSTTKTQTNPEGADYEKYFPYMDKETWQQVHRWAKCVMFMNDVPAIEKKGLKAKAVGSNRMMTCFKTPTCDAKNWWGIEDYIDGGTSAKEGYDAFVSEYKKQMTLAK